MKNANLYDRYAAHFPAAAVEFLRDEAGTVVSYGELARRSAQIAGYLIACGVSAGDRITVQAEKCPTFIWLYLACLRAGLVFHPLNPAYTEAELDYFIGDAVPSMLIGDAAAVVTLGVLASRYAVPRVLSLATLNEESAQYPADFVSHDVSPDTLAALLYSSGTTGKPKGIMLSHGNLATNAAALTRAWGFTTSDVLLHMLPLFHVHGLFIALGCTLMSGSRLLFCARFDAGLAVRRLSEATVMMGVPTYYTRLLAQPTLTPESCDTIRLFTSGSAPLLSETWLAFKNATGHAVLERYGMTETSIIATNPLDGVRRPGAVGPALAGVEIRIADATDQSLAVGNVGQVQVRGKSVFQGYWRKPDKTREDFTADGYFRTGDDGMQDADGYLWLLGRAKDLIITGGLNVYPSEIEQVLDGLPMVQESAVIGLPHPDFGEQVAAVIVLRPEADWDEEAVRATVRHSLAAFKCPKQYRIAAELPRNAMGKVQKNLLRAEAANAPG